LSKGGRACAVDPKMKASSKKLEKKININSTLGFEKDWKRGTI